MDRNYLEKRKEEVMGGRLLDSKIQEVQDQIIAEKYLAGWRKPVIASYIGISIGLVNGRLQILKRDKKVKQRMGANDGLKGY